MTEVERHELISDFINKFKNHFIDLFYNLYEKTKSDAQFNKFVLRDFQNRLKDISVWSNSKKEDIFRAWKTEDVEKFLDDLSSINYQIYKRENEKITSIDFLYNCSLTIAMEIWTKPIIFYHRVSKSEYQKNRIIIEKTIASEIKTSIRRIQKKKVVVEEVVVVEEIVNNPIQESVTCIIDKGEINCSLDEKINEDEDEDSDEEDDSDNVSDNIITVYEKNKFDDFREISTNKIKELKLPRSHKLFESDALTAYNRYLNPNIFKPPPKTS